MPFRNFHDLIAARWERGNFLCIGLDPDIEKIPESVQERGIREKIVTFNKAIIDATKDLVCAFKPNSAFYERHGDEGWLALRETIQYVLDQAPDVPVIFDGKRADIGNTNAGYVSGAFDHLHADAITVHPYMGGESLQEFFARKEKGIFVMCKNSNEGSSEFQDLMVDNEPLFMRVAQAFAEKWNAHKNVGLVVGATYPEDVKRVREVAPTVPLLIPGIGPQGGDLASSVQNAKDAHGRGFTIATARAVLYASSGSDFAEAAQNKAQEFDSAIKAALVQ